MLEWPQAELLCFQPAAGQWQGLREGDVLGESRAAAGGGELVANPSSCVHPTALGPRLPPLSLCVAFACWGTAAVLCLAYGLGFPAQ